MTAEMVNLVVSGSMTVPAVVVASTYTEHVNTNGISTYNASDIEVSSPMHITGYSTSLYSSHDQLYGSLSDYTRIGLKVDDSILADTLLTISDQRLKKDIVVSDADKDFKAVVDLPVKRFRYVDHDEEETLGFIAQEVEEVAPFAVRTVRGPVPTVVSNAERISDTTILVTSNYGQIENDSFVKLVIAGKDVVRKVVSRIGGEVTFDEALPEGDVFVYGPIVDDLKLLDNDRLIPLAFNAIKKLHMEAQAQKDQMKDILTRLAALEARLA